MEWCCRYGNFNPRSPHGERQHLPLRYQVHRKFQSTLPAWGATWRPHASSVPHRDFNPRSPHGERQNSILLPNVQWTFQSTLPAWGATGKATWKDKTPDISIHAPRMGSDPGCGQHLPRPSYFNPRSPHGERPYSRDGSALNDLFQSTLPAWGATHAAGWIHYGYTDFNPRSPHGERRVIKQAVAYDDQFQSTLPAWGATGVLRPSL